jgi:GNAT superfamily N-acetyltransferase
VTRVGRARIWVDELDDELAAALPAIDSAALDGVPLRHHRGRSLQLECQDRYGEGPDQALWLARAGDELVGYAALSLNRFALDGAKVVGAVHPDHQRRGIGRRSTHGDHRTNHPTGRNAGWSGVRAVPWGLKRRRPETEPLTNKDHRGRRPALSPSAPQPSGWAPNGPVRAG